MLNNFLSYYAQPGPLTEPREQGDMLRGLPMGFAALRDVLQGCCVHIFWVRRYGLELDDARQVEVQLRPAWQKLAQIRRLDAAPLTTLRPPERRLVCNCRDFSLLYSTMLRSQGVPARARCGFATYFEPGHYEDHWVVEAWDASQLRWRWIDTQLDALQCDVLGIDFDPLDMPAGKFVTGGQAWKMCRAGQANPDDFGIFEWKGMDFVRGNAVRDFVSLNKVETLPWDFWGLLLAPIAESQSEAIAFVDCLAEMAEQPVERLFPAIRVLYNETPDLIVPGEWFV